MKLILLLSFVAVATAVEFRIRNNLQGPIRVGILGNNQKPPLEGGGFELQQGEEKSVTSDDNWAGRFWARTYCDPNSNHCETGSCGDKLQCNGAGGEPPATLVEITLKGDQGNDFYDISNVDGFNVVASIQPIDGEGDCKTVSCSTDINNDCPGELQVKNGDTVIACKSSCLEYNTDEYCCRGAYGTPETCNPDNWEVNSAKVFKKDCPDAYSYAYDDSSSTFVCKSQVYSITFG